MATPRSFYDGSTGSPKGAASGEALAVSPSLSSARTACTLKGGCLSIATQGSYCLSSPHPLALSPASRPGIPATAETRSRARTRGCRAERGAKARGEGHARTSPSNLSPARTACTLKGGGCLSIGTQGSYWPSNPHPLAMSMASRPGMPATAETSLRAGTQGCRAERGAKARGKEHVRTSPSNPSPARART